MLPLPDGVPARRFPVVNVALIVTRVLTGAGQIATQARQQAPAVGS
jgi:hypothetical protein